MMPVLIVAAKLVGAWWFVDVMSGIYHYATDRGWNIPSQVAEFQHHHRHPDTFYPGPYSLIASLPLFALGYLVDTDIYFLAVAVSAIEVPHWLAHAKVDWFPLRVLRATGAVISTEQHDGHHNSPQFDRNYCIVTSWNNWWFNPLARMLVIPQRRARGS